MVKRLCGCVGAPYTFELVKICGQVVRDTFNLSTVEVPQFYNLKFSNMEIEV